MPLSYFGSRSVLFWLKKIGTRAGLSLVVSLVSTRRPRMLGENSALATLAVKFPIKYYSDSQAKWVDAEVCQIATDGSIDLNCKPGVFQHIQTLNGG